MPDHKVPKEQVHHPSKTDVSGRGNLSFLFPDSFSAEMRMKYKTHNIMYFLEEYNTEY